MTTMILLAVLAVIIFVLIAGYNQLVSRRQTCNQGWADIDAQLKQRHDLVPNLVATVQGYAGHEKLTLEAVIAARNSAINASTPTSAAAAEGALSGALKSIFALSESYPDLKANTNFQTLQLELADVEDKLAASRRAYNAACADYNGACEAFPAVLYAKSMGFAHRDFWELNDGEKAVASLAPVVKF